MRQTMTEPKQFPGPLPGARRIERDWPDQPLITGPIRISGTVLGGDACWYVYRDALCWTNVVLVGREPEDPRWRRGLDPIFAEAAEQSTRPTITAAMVARALGPAAREVELGVVRIAPHHDIAEVLNVSLPALVHWDPLEGMVPYEPVAHDLSELPARAATEVVRLDDGAALVGVTRGLLSRSAGWSELRALLRASAIDPLGGDVAEAAPSEIGRMLLDGWRLRGGPTGLVVVGAPVLERQVA